MQIFCVNPHPLRDHFAIISRPLYPINVLSVSYVYLFWGEDMLLISFETTRLPL